MFTHVSASGDQKVAIELDEVASGHLLSFLLHAKFSEDFRLEIAGSPTMQSLLHGLIEARRELAFDRMDSTGWQEIHEEGGMQAPTSFLMIEERLRRLLKREPSPEELAEYLYPFVWKKVDEKQRFIPPGIRVRLPDAVEFENELPAECGIVIQCWRDDSSKNFNCFVALIRDQSLDEIPSQRPLVRMYPASSLTVV